MGWMSPNDLNNNPKKFLNIPHELHESILNLMEKLYPGFKQRLIDTEVHCLECEGQKPIKVFTLDKGPGMCTGYIGKPGSKDILLNISHDDKQSVVAG